MSSILMFLSNSFRPDPRVAREAAALSKRGHQVTVICWDRENRFTPQEKIDGYAVERIQTVRTKYGAGVRQILHTPRFWLAAARMADELHPDAIHCHDLDTLPAGWWVKKRLKIPMIYDAHEDYPALMSLYLPRLFTKLLSWLESRLLIQADFVVTASTILADKWKSLGVSPIATIGNYHDLSQYDQVSNDDIRNFRTHFGISSTEINIAYIGGFSRNRQLIPLLKTAVDMPDIKISLWGDGHQKSAIESLALELPNIAYHGWLDASHVPTAMKAIDIVFYCLREDYPGAKYNAPNTLSQAMAAGRPIIANDVGDLGRIVRQTGCGILVPDVSIRSIQAAIDKLRDSKMRENLGKAGRRAAEQHYNWTAASEKLIDAYAYIIEKG